MFFELKAGKVLLVEGPMAIIVRKGYVSVLGADVVVGKRVVVRRGKLLLIQALQDSTPELIEGEGSARIELPNSTIPELWTRTVYEIVSHRLSPIVVFGDIDRGKNTFCIYLTDIALKEGLFGSFY